MEHIKNKQQFYLTWRPSGTENEISIQYPSKKLNLRQEKTFNWELQSVVTQ